MTPWVVDPSTVAPTYTDRGVPYKPLWKLVPWLEPYYTAYEKNYNAADHFLLIRDNAWFPLTLVSLYMLFIFIGPKVMKNRKPFDLKPALAFWNLFLSLFSAIGAVRILSHFIYLVLPAPYGGGFTVRDTLCAHPEGVYADGATGLWAFLFTFSKCIELIDTVFVVLRKKPLIFLHWYHHVSVLLCAWFGHASESPALYYMSMNYSIHAIMYFYFFAVAIGIVPKWFNPNCITVLQISQMFVGTWVVGMSAYYKFFAPGDGCNVANSALMYLGIMYLSYAYLFVAFFVTKFMKMRSGKKSKKV